MSVRVTCPHCQTACLVAEQAWRADRDIATALDQAFGHELDGVDPAQREKMETLNGIHSNAAGLRRWLEKRAERVPHAH